MRRYTLSECSMLFGVDPKTFRAWLARDQIEPQTSRADPRIKYLTEEQVQRLAVLHDHPLGAGQPPHPEVISPAAYKLLIEQVAELERTCSAALLPLPGILTELAALGERATLAEQQGKTLTEALAHAQTTARQAGEDLRAEMQQQDDALTSRIAQVHEHVTAVNDALTSIHQELTQRIALLEQHDTTQEETLHTLQGRLVHAEQYVRALDQQIQKLARVGEDQTRDLEIVHNRNEQIATNAEETHHLLVQMQQQAEAQTREIAALQRQMHEERAARTAWETWAKQMTEQLHALVPAEQPQTKQVRQRKPPVE